MKNIMMILGIILIVGFTLTNTTESRADWCRLVCEDIAYGPVMTQSFSSGACSYEVDFAYRYADCGEQIQWCDFFIVEIRPVGTCSDPSITPFSLMNSAQQAILTNATNNPCFPSQGGCSSAFSISYASCWYWDGFVGTSGPGTAVLKPCDETQCCRNIYQVCYYPPGPPLPTLISTIGINPVCPSGECFNICEEFSQPPSIPSGIEKDNETGHSFKTSVFPNPSSDVINLKIESDTEGELTIEINDVSGNIIVTKNIIKKQGEIQLQFKMNSYSNGNYYFVVKQNGKQVSSGSFNLVK